MDAKSLEERGREIHKVTNGGDPPETLITLLEPLKNWTATEKLLRQTKLGVYVNKLRQNQDKQLASLAAQLVNKWKSDVKKTGGSSAATGSPAPTPKAGATTNGSASPAPGATPKQETMAPKSKYSGDKEKRNAATDKVNTNITGNATRDACVKLMYDGLAFGSEESPEEILRVARSVELAAYNLYQPETSSEYKTKLRSFFQNLKNKSNPGLRANVLSGTIAPERFVAMTHDEMKSDKMKELDEKLQKENFDKAMVAQEEKSISSSLQCGKCGQKKVSYSQAQTRSADEPMTTFCQCTVCGNRWKFS
ncbi:hypothetical protein MBLNU457_g0057t1 [Dothideomycetes sp. NU457]